MEFVNKTKCDCNICNTIKMYVLLILILPRDQEPGMFKLA